jgi:hypothetical protein
MSGYVIEVNAIIPYEAEHWIANCFFELCKRQTDRLP